MQLFTGGGLMKKTLNDQHIMSRQYTKREFLKLLGGLGLGFIPFISCYERGEHKNNASDGNKSAYPRRLICQVLQMRT